MISLSMCPSSPKSCQYFMIQFIVFVLSVATAALVFSKKYKLIPIYMYVVFLFTLDYANYYFKLDSSVSGYFVKTYAEILFIFTAVYFVIKSLSMNRINKIVGCSLLFLVFTIAVGIGKNGLLNAILDWRSSVFPIIFPMLLIYSKIVNLNSAKKIMNFVCLLTLLNTGLALFQYYTFNGDPQSSWRYDFLVNAHENNEVDTENRLISYQIVRGDELRASGIFVSALQYSYLGAMSAFYIFLSLVVTRKKKIASLVGYGLLFLFLVCGMLVSQVRASFIILAVAILLYLICTKKSSTGISFRANMALLLILVNYVILLLVLFVFGAESLDSSAAGRIPQYLKAISEFSIIGSGLGKYRRQFDSDFVYGFLTFGVAFLFIPFLFVKMFKEAFSKKVAYVGGNSIIVVMAFCMAVSAATVSLFQHLSGSAFYYMVWLLLIASAARDQVVNFRVGEKLNSARDFQSQNI